ncbi:MAG: type I restriction enzyme S subunit [Psychromonas sp.]|jgi:type I restriction enzyme S subunit|uniref:restriction endonuclease subunit S n=1 Tax=Psychromonas sp. TaxID=1884585 RepID=UPI0039E486F9
MSNLNFMEKLLDGVAVEWKELSEIVTTVTAPSKLKKNDYCLTGSIPIIDQGAGYIAGFTDLNVSPIECDKYVIFGDHSEHIKYVDFAFVQGADGLKILKSCSDNTKFIYYAFLNFYRKELSYKRHWSTAKETLIPIPCPENPEKSLKIQAEIVRILDLFTTMTIELTTELNARKKQYSYYREQLLSFEEAEVEWKPLGELGEFIRGKRFTKKDYVADGGVKVIHYGEIYTHYGTSSTSAISQVRANLAESLRYAEPNDVIVASVGETIEDVGKAVAWLGEEKVAIHDDSYAIRHSLNPKYLSYCLQTEDFTAEKTKHVSRGKVKRLLIDGISKVRIPIPYPNDSKKSLTEQARIVTILDKFDTFTNSRSEGLPREIELRQKQYEYYRDLLLNFPKLEMTEEA